MAHYIASSVWGGTSAPVTTHHGEDVRAWNPDCSWYQYGIQYCLNGCQHPGMDIGVSYVNLYAKRGGRVIMAGFYDFYRPYHVQVETANGDIDIYGHMWSIDPAVIEGGTVAAGQLLGVSGEQTYRETMTPDGSGAHLHFEVRRPDSSCSSGYRAVDPEPILTGTDPGGGGGVAKVFVRGDTIEVIDGPLNLRSGPGVGHATVESLATGTILCVLAGPTNTDGYTWHEVEDSATGVVGYLAGEFCELVTAGGCSSFARTDQIDVTDGPLNVRSGPGVGYEVVTSLAIGTAVCVSPDNDPVDVDGYRWYEIWYGTATESVQGWAVARFFRLLSAGGCGGGAHEGFTAGDKIQVIDGPLNMRTGPGLGYGIVASLGTWTNLCVTGTGNVVDGHTWYPVEVLTTKERGSVAARFCGLVAPDGCTSSSGEFAVGDQIEVIDGPLNMRTGPGTGYNVVVSLATGDQLCVLDGPVSADGYTWYKIDTGSSQGWTVGEFCGLIAAGGCRTSSAGFLVGDTIEVVDGPLNLRSDPSTDAAVTGSVATGMALCVLDGPTSNSTDVFTWYRVDGDGQQGWTAGDYCTLLKFGGCL